MSDGGSSFKLGYHPGLDGLRGLALVIVVLFHAQVPFVHLGHVGLIAFFVLSAFLITSLLFQQHGRHGAIDVRDYLERRARRIIPAITVFGLAVGVYVHLTAAAETARAQWLSVLAALTHVGNWVEGLTQHPTLLVQHTWSVSVEVQFYIAWLVIMVWLLRRPDRDWRRVAIVILGVGAAVAVIRGLWWGLNYRTDNLLYPRILTGTDLRVDQLGIGCVLGIAYAKGWLEPLRGRRGLLTLLGAAGVAVFMWIATVGIPLTWLFAGGSTLVALASAAVILAVVYAPESPVARGFAHPAMVWLGTISYAVYLYHVPIFRILREKAAAWPLGQQVLVGTVLSVALGVLSTYTIERWARTPRSERTAAGGIEGPVSTASPRLSSARPSETSERL